jgi:hypothetical protein
MEIKQRIGEGEKYKEMEKGRGTFGVLPGEPLI